MGGSSVYSGVLPAHSRLAATRKASRKGPPGDAERPGLALDASCAQYAESLLRSGSSGVAANASSNGNIAGLDASMHYSQLRPDQSRTPTPSVHRLAPDLRQRLCAWS